MTPTHRAEVSRILTCDALFAAYVVHLKHAEEVARSYKRSGARVHPRTRASITGWGAALRERSIELDPENDLGIR